MMTDNNDTRRDLVLNVKNFGPIAEAKDIEIKPMTVFVGPSNTGKSYLAVLVHSIMSANLRPRSSYFLPALQSEPITLLNEEEFNAIVHDVLFCIKNDKYQEYIGGGGVRISFSYDSLQNSKKVIQSHAMRYMHTIGSKYSESIREYFDIQSLDELVSNSNSDSDLKIIINDDKLGTYKISNVNDVETSSINSETLKFSRLAISFEADIDIQNEEISSMVEMIKDEFDKFKSKLIKSLQQEIIDKSLLNRISGDLTRQYMMIFSNYFKSLYLPATRSGIIAGHNILTDSIIANASSILFKDKNIPLYRKIHSDFLRMLLRSNSSSQSYGESYQEKISKIAEIIETSLFNGKLDIVRQEFGMPEFRYSTGNLSVPLSRSSSMISEISPIIIALKSQLNLGDLLIIEEPEAHLHPAAQQKMAAALALMVRNGLRVLITTHSYDMVEQIGTLVNASHADERQRHGIGLGDPSIEKDVYLTEDEVGMYGFTPREDGSGTDVIPIEIDQDYAYSPKSFSKALSDQFNRNNRFIKARIDAE